MSAGRTLALTIALSLAAVSIGAGTASAQTGNPNPSGGTFCRPVTLESAPTSLVTTDVLRSSTSLDVLVRQWVVTLAARHIAPIGPPATWTTMRATQPRRFVRR